MHRLLERLDAAASTLVPLLYLAGLTGGAVAYFTGITADFGIAVGLGLATAAELHSFLQQRRTRASWALYARTRRAGESEAADATRRAFTTDAVILAALLAFSAFNAIAFAAATWHPSPSFLPPGVQIAIRGLIVPVFFFLSGFLAPLVADAGAMLARASHDMLDRTLRVAVRQWKRRIDAAAKGGLDLAPIAAALMEDAGDVDGAKRVRLIADGLAAVEGRRPMGYLPTGPGTPLFDGSNGMVDASIDGLTTEPTRPLAMVTRPAPRRPGHPRSNGRAVRTRRRPDETELKARQAWHPGMGVRALARAAHISENAASKWAAVLTEEWRRKIGDGGDEDEAAAV